MRRLTIIALLAMTAGPAALAGEGHDPERVVQHIFQTADRDQDGLLSPDEYAAAGLEGFGVPFEDSDLDGDGATSADEYLELYLRHHPPGDGTDV